MNRIWTGDRSVSLYPIDRYRESIWQPRGEGGEKTAKAPRKEETTETLLQLSLAKFLPVYINVINGERSAVTPGSHVIPVDISVHNANALKALYNSTETHLYTLAS